MRKQQYLVKTILSSFLILAFLVVIVKPVSAQDGGEVQVKGEITLFDDSSSSSSSDSNSSSSEPRDSSASSNLPNTSGKPRGRLPSTGELVKYSVLISGFLLIVLLLVFYWLKHRKNNERGNE